MNGMNTTQAKWPRGEKFADDAEHDYWDHETGMPTLMHASNALQVWAVFHGGPVTVRMAGEAFNLDDVQVRELVQAHSWMYLHGPDDDATKQLIEHDGE